jgi:hypothetical protein
VIYFIRAGTDGPIKIGVADAPWQRLDTLQIGCPDKLCLLGVICPKQDYIEERKIHTLFADERRRGEWFDASSRLLEYIKANAKALYPERKTSTHIDINVKSFGYDVWIVKYDGIEYEAKLTDFDGKLPDLVRYLRAKKYPVTTSTNDLAVFLQRQGIAATFESYDNET